MADVGSENVEMSAVEIQQQYYEAIGDVDWERYEKKDRGILLQKVALAVCGPPTEEGNLIDLYANSDQPQPPKLQGYDPRNEEIAMTVFKKICEQATHSHNGENIYVSFIRVVCVIPAKEIPRLKVEPADYWVDLHDKKGKDVIVSIFHVFGIRRCIPSLEGEKACRIFIDHDARVYKDWESYLKENKLPKAIMVVPTNGKYQGFIENDTAVVLLTVLSSPALGIGARVLSIADTTNTAVGVSALIGTVGLIAAPVAAPAAVIAVGTAYAVTSVYGIIRSSIHLADRGNHEQSIGFGDASSRGAWINLFVSTAGLSFAAAGQVLKWAATAGVNVRILLNAFQILKYTTLGGGLLGVVNSLGEMIYKYTKYQEKPTKLELFQFTSSLLFFGIGVMSNQTAQEIVEDAQANKINNIRESLTSKAKRKMFDKVTAETRRIRGTIEGNTEVIRSLKVITDKNEFFAKLSSMNKQFNENKLRVSLSSDGAAIFNNRVKLTISQLTELGRDCRNKLLATFEPADLTTKNVPTRIYPKGANAMMSSLATPAATQANEPFSIRAEEVIKIFLFIKNLSTLDKEKICEMLSDLSSELHQAFLLFCAELIGALLPDCFNFLGPDWKIKIIRYVIDYLRKKYGSHGDADSDLKSIIKRFLVEGRIKPDDIERLKEHLMKCVSEAKTKKQDPFDLKKYDGVHGFGSGLRNNFVKLQAGIRIKFGVHGITIKKATIENLQEWLQSYSQEKSDYFLEICKKVIVTMTTEEVKSMYLINPDEDVLMRIAEFINSWKKKETVLKSCTDVDFHTVKKLAISWIIEKQVREPEKCALCKGYKYIAKKPETKK